MEGFGPVVLIEGILFFGGALLFYWWQMRSLKRDREAAQRKKERETARENESA